MNYLKIIYFILFSNILLGQTQNFNDLPYIETSAKMDTIVIPDKIYIKINISENDTKGKITVEKLDLKMVEILKNLNINLDKQLETDNITKTLKKTVFKQEEIISSKIYTLLVFDGKTTSKVYANLENIGITNLKIEKVEFSKIEDLRMSIVSKTILKAKNKAIAMVTPLNQKVGNAIYISNTKNLDVLIGENSITKNPIINQLKPEDFFEVNFQKIKLETEINVKFKLDNN